MHVPRVPVTKLSIVSVPIDIVINFIEKLRVREVDQVMFQQNAIYPILSGEKQTSWNDVR